MLRVLQEKFVYNKLRVLHDLGRPRLFPPWPLTEPAPARRPPFPGTCGVARSGVTSLGRALAAGTKHNDPQFCDEIERYLGEQVKAIKDMASYVAQIKRLGTGHGVWDLDKEIGEATANVAA